MNRFVIIAGATKSGTTSLFNYLSDHPEVCPASFKETRYFLNANYPIKRMGSGGDYSISEYIDFFNCENHQFKLEGTPDYLYSDSTAQIIRYTLREEDVKIVFILRNPIDRFISWYKFAMQNGKIDTSTTLQDFIKENEQAIGQSSAPQHQRALEQGLYSKYLQNYFDVFGIDKIKIIYFSDLINQPNSTLREISLFMGIEPSFYDVYETIQFNKTVLRKNPKAHGYYKKIKRNLRELFRSPKMRKPLKKIGKIIDRLYSKINSNTVENEKFELEDKIYKQINGFYSDELNLFKKRKYGTPKN